MNGVSNADAAKQRLRVAIFNRHFSSTGGGAERYSIAMVEALADRHEFHVFAQHIHHRWPSVIYHQVPHWFEKPRWLNQLFFATYTWWKTRTGFDVVHSHENTWHGQVQTVHVLPIKFNLLHGISGVKRVLRLIKIATSPRLLVYLALERGRYSLTSPKAIVLASESLRGQMETAYPQSVQALTVVTPGVHEVKGRPTEDLKMRQRIVLGLPLDAFVILFVGNDYQKKGLTSLIDAMSKLPMSCHLAVVGHRRQEGFFLKLANASCVSDRVHFLGSLEKVEVAYQMADCLVHPTLEDTFAMVVLEAMAQGLPVVVSDDRYCGISAHLTHFKNALILDLPTDSNGIVSAVNQIMDCNDFKNEIIESGLRFAEDYLWVKLAKKQESIYFKLINNETDELTKIQSAD